MLKCNTFTLELRGYHHYVHYYLFGDIFLVWDMFPSSKNQGDICIRSYRYQNESRTFKYHETECLFQLYSIRTTKIQSWTKFWECPILRPITQDCLTSEWHHMLFEGFSVSSVTVFALSVQPGISERVM